MPTDCFNISCSKPNLVPNLEQLPPTYLGKQQLLADPDISLEGSALDDAPEAPAFFIRGAHQLDLLELFFS